MNLYEQAQLLKNQAANGMSVARSGIVQDDNKPYVLPLESWRVTATGALLGAVAGTPAGAFGLTMGTFGAASPKIAGEAASAASKTNKMRRTFPLPAEYVAGESVTLRIRCKETVGVATVATTIDAVVYKADKDGGIGADICATNAQDVTNAFANKDFDITPTGLVPGDVLDIEINVVTNDTGGAVGTIVNITDTELLLDVKG